MLIFLRGEMMDLSCLCFSNSQFWNSPRGWSVSHRGVWGHRRGNDHSHTDTEELWSRTWLSASLLISCFPETFSRNHLFSSHQAHRLPNITLKSLSFSLSHAIYTLSCCAWQLGADHGSWNPTPLLESNSSLQIPAPLFTTHVTLKKLISLSMPSFLHL
mgnify:CR=1 FL=1